MKYIVNLDKAIVDKARKSFCLYTSVQELREMKLSKDINRELDNISKPIITAYNTTIRSIITSILGYKYYEKYIDINWNINFSTNSIIFESDMDIKTENHKYLNNLRKYDDYTHEDTFVAFYNRSDMHHTDMFRLGAIKRYIEFYLRKINTIGGCTSKSIICGLITDYIDISSKLIMLIFEEMYELSYTLGNNVYIYDLRVMPDDGILSAVIRYNHISDLNTIFDHGWEELTDDNKYKWSEFVQLDAYANILYNIDKHNDPDGISMDITFQITDACNLCCTYCYQHAKGSRYMTFDTAKKAVDYLLNTTEKNCEYINPSIIKCIGIEFVGGDGLMNITLVDQIMTYFVQQLLLKNHPWKYSWLARISTNGVLYRDQTVQTVLSKWEKLLPCVITVDGDKTLHDKCRVFKDGSGSYDYAIDAVYGEINRGIVPSSKITLSPDNLDYFENSIQDFVKKGMRHIWFNGVYEHEWTPQEANKYYNILKRVTNWLIDNNYIELIEMMVFKYGDVMHPQNTDLDKNHCGGNGHMLAFDPDGNIFNCTRYMKSSLGDTRPEIILGSVDRGIGRTTEDITNIRILQECTVKSQSTQECINCPMSVNCGYCSGYNYELYGTPNKRSTNICNLHKAELLAAYYYWGKIKSLKLFSYRDINLDSLEFNIEYTIVAHIISKDDYTELVQLYK